MLDKRTRAHVEANWKGWREDQTSTYNERIVKCIDRALEDLTLIAKKLPEELLAKTLTPKRLRPFFSALLMPQHDGKQYQDAATDRPAGPQQRRLEIATLMMNLGTAKCLESVPEPYELIMQESALTLMLALTHQVTGRRDLTVDDLFERIQEPSQEKER